MDLRELVKRIGGGTELARLLGTTPQAVTNMTARGSIPAKYWPVLLKVAAEHGIEVSADDLMKMAADNAAKRVAEAQATSSGEASEAAA